MVRGGVYAFVLFVACSSVHVGGDSNLVLGIGSEAQTCEKTDHGLQHHSLHRFPRSWNHCRINLNLCIHLHLLLLLFLSHHHYSLCQLDLATLL